MRSAKLIVLFTVFLDVIGIGITLPLLPIYLHTLTNSAFLAAAFFAIYSLFGFFSAPILGTLSDRYGRRPILIWSLFGSALGWIIFAAGNTIPWLIAGRVIQGLASGNIATAQSVFSDISTTKHERIANFGLIGATFGVGFIIGPALGALLASVSLTLPFWITAIVSLGNAIAAVFLFPETHDKRDPHHPISIHPFSGIAKALRNSEARPFVMVFFLFMMSFALFQSVFPLYTHLVYGLGAVENGWIMTFMGVVIALNQGFFLRRVWLRYFHERTLQTMFLLILIGVNIAFAMKNWFIFLVMLFVLPFCQSILRIVTLNEITEATHEKERGEALGMTQSLMFLASVISPMIGGWLLEYDGAYPWIFGAVMLAGAFGVLQWHTQKNSSLL